MCAFIRAHARPLVRRVAPTPAGTDPRSHVRDCPYARIARTPKHPRALARTHARTPRHATHSHANTDEHIPLVPQTQTSAATQADRWGIQKPCGFLPALGRWCGSGIGPARSAHSAGARARVCVYTRAGVRVSACMRTCPCVCAYVRSPTSNGCLGHACRQRALRCSPRPSPAPSCAAPTKCSSHRCCCTGCAPHPGSPPTTSAPRLGSPPPISAPGHVCIRTRLTLPHLRRDSARCCHICAGTRLTPPHLRRDSRCRGVPQRTAGQGGAAGPARCPLQRSPTALTQLYIVPLIPPVQRVCACRHLPRARLVTAHGVSRKRPCSIAVHSAASARARLCSGLV